MRSTLLTAALLLAAIESTLAQSYDECRHEAQRSAEVDAAAARQLRIKAAAGALRIEGKAGLSSVVIRGRACASDAQLLEEIELRADRRGSDVVVDAMQRDRGWSFTGNRYARLDLVIEVPARIAADITDGSGSIHISNLGEVSITDGSGEIVASDIHGDMRIEDGSGSIHLRNVGGLIDVTDGSGEIDIRTARNSVRISDGSGGIEVTDVDGDFTVTRSGSGGIGYSNVKGRVDIPDRRGRRREAL